MTRIRYYIEQAPDRFYDAAAPAKARARRLSRSADGGCYVIAEQFDASIRDYTPVGSIAYYRGYRDAVEGIFA